MSITLLIFFLINFHFMEKNGYYRDFFHSLSSNCTIKYENFRSFDFQSDMKLQFLYPIRFMFHMKIYLYYIKTDLYCKQICHRLHFKRPITGFCKTFCNRKSTSASAIGTAFIPCPICSNASSMARMSLSPVLKSSLVS